MVEIVLLLTAVAAAQAPRPVPAPAATVQIGVDVSADDDAAAAAVLAGVRSGTVPDADGPAVEVVEGCEKTSFCLTVVVAPVRVGTRVGGWALAGYVSRRLSTDARWPWPPEGPPGQRRIEDAYTAGEGGGCVGCQMELEAVQRTLRDVREGLPDLMVDEGDLQLRTGPAETGFLNAAGADLGRAVLERHVRPWAATRVAAGPSAIIAP